MIPTYIYYFLLFCSNIGALITTFISKNKKLLSIKIYVFIGLIFELVFIYQKYNSILPSTLIFDIVFPACIFTSVIIRFTVKYFNPLIVFIITISVLFLILDNFDFLAVNYLLSISSLLFIAVYRTRRTSPKFINVLDIVFSFGLYLMFLNYYISYKYSLWESSSLLNIFHAGFTWYLIITLILVNVKFWRHITH